MSLKIASLFAQIGADTSGFETGAKKVKGGLGDIGGAFKSIIPPSVAQFATLGGAAAGVGLAIKKVMDTTLQYANDVRTLSRVSGAGAEDTSRFIQVIDDYNISAAEALLATKALTKEGYTPSIDTLAKLSDQYLALNTAEEKNAFVLKNLGKGGLQWVEVLSKGSKALREQGAAVNKNLILNEEVLKQARELELAQDDWNDAMQAAQLTLGTKALPTLTRLTTGTLEASEAVAGEVAWYERLIPAVGAVHSLFITLRTALGDNTAETEAAADATKMLADAQETAAESAKAQEEALRAISDVNLGILGTIGDMQAAEENYQKTAADLIEERKQIEHDKAVEIAKGWEMDREKIADYDAALLENTRQVQENEKEHKRANLEIISGLVERKLMQDGVLTNEEFEWLIQKRQAWGLYSADVVQKARAAWQEADRITSSITSIPDNKTISITTNYFQNVHGSSGGSRDSGGPGVAGQSYMIGTGAQPEMFIPNTNGTFVPNAGMGGGNTEKLLKKIANNTASPKVLARAIRDALTQAGTRG